MSLISSRLAINMQEHAMCSATYEAAARDSCVVNWIHSRTDVIYRYHYLPWSENTSHLFCCTFRNLLLFPLTLLHRIMNFYVQKIVGYTSLHKIIIMSASLCRLSVIAQNYMYICLHAHVSYPLLHRIIYAHVSIRYCTEIYIYSI
jgi:hypothetical protein